MAAGAAIPSESGNRGAGVPPAYSEQFPDMLIAYLTGKLNSLAASWDRKRAVLRTAAELQARNAWVREKVLQMLGTFPQRSALDSVTVRVTERDGYRIENILFRSRTDFWVPGNLYIPTSGAGPFPGIVSPCGHYPLARMLPQYQAAHLSLVKSGFVVFSWDPIGQGERRQYWNPANGVTEVSADSVYEHSMPGQLLLLLGENLTQYLVWDGVRAVDYLLTRPEVDPRKIGCAGHSGGGTLTKFMSVVDDRIQCAAILEGGTANRWPQKIAPWQPVGEPDVEQNLFPAALLGIDNVDLHAAIAPRPLLAGVEQYGPAFDQAVEAIRARYRQLGVPEKFATVSADDPHSWTPKLRLATVDWFSRWFYNRPGPQTEPHFEIEAEQLLYCTADGSIRYSGKGLGIFSVIAKKQAELPPLPPVPTSREEREAWQSRIRGSIRELLRYRHSSEPLGVRPIVTTARDGYRIEKIQFLSEPGIYIPAWVYVPDQSTRNLPAILYVTDEGMETEGMEFEGAEGAGLTHGMLQTLALAGNLVVAVDVRGIGETRPSHPPQSIATNKFSQLFDVETAMSYMAWSMDQSLLGMRVQDVVRAVDYIATRQEADAGNVHVIGKGTGGLWCLYAAALDPRIGSLISVRSLLSCRSLAQSDRYLYGADVFVPDMLLHFDLPQVAAAIASRPLVLIYPADAMKKDVDEDSAQQAYRWTRDVYAAAGLQSRFKVEAGAEQLDSAEHYLNLIRSFSA